MPSVPPPTYRERLWPPVWGWLLVVLWPGVLGIAYGYATTAVVGWLVAGLSAGLAAVGLLDWAATITVDATGVTAGRVHLPSEHLGPAVALDAEQARRLRGVAADARAFLLVRGWVGCGVRLDVSDPLDPTPYWYLSSRRPEQLATAIRTAADQAQVR